MARKEKKQKQPRNKNQSKRRVKVVILIIVVTLFFSLGYLILSGQLAAQNISQRLRESVIQKGIYMEDSLQPEIALTKKMAASPLLRKYFLNPDDPELKKIAFEELRSYRDAFSSHIIFWANDKDKDFYNGMEYSYTIDPNNQADYWYKMTLYETDIFNFNINYNAELDMTCLWLNAVVRDDKGKPIGMCGTGIELDSYIEKCFEGLHPNQQMYLINNTKEITGAVDKTFIVEKKSIDEIYNNRFNFDDLMEKAKAAPNGDICLFYYSNIVCAIKYLPSYDWYIFSTTFMTNKEQNSNVLLIIITFIIEITFIIFIIFISKLKNVMRMITISQKNEHEMGAKLFEEAQNLVVATKETAATSQDSAAAVKEIVATMEDSNVLSENISTKIKDVSTVANKTSSDVTEGVSQIEQNVKQLHEIFNANQQTIDGIKTLSDKIESIWDIVTLINNVADQAKIIAFNAELEASTAGEAGKSFRIVANEIRRLSDGIIEGTREIKEKINEIQHSSDSLILASESGTEKINAGYENARGLGEKFESIKRSAEITAGSAKDISDIIQQQANASEQILVTLKEIAGGVENFTIATDNISAAAEEVRKISEALNNTQK